VIGQLIVGGEALAAVCLRKSPTGEDEIQLARLSPSENKWRYRRIASGKHMFAPVAALGDGGTLHVAWCDVCRRLWYACIDLNRPQRPLHPPAVVYTSSRQVDIALCGRTVLLAFESDINDVGFVKITDAAVEHATETLASATHVLYERVQPGNRPAHVQWTLASSTRHLTRDVFHSPQFSRDPDGCLWLIVANSTREGIWGCRWLGRSWSPMVNYGGIPALPLRADYSRVILGDFSIPRKFHRWPVAAHLTAEPPATGSTLRVICPAELHAKPDRKILFFDLRELSRLVGLQIVPRTAEKYPDNPVLKPEDPRAFDAERVFNTGTVLHQSGKFRMWYSGIGTTDRDKEWWHWCKLGYAESDDGFHWRRVDLGKLEAPNANVIGEMKCYVTGICYDEAEADPQKRYKQLELFSCHYERELAQAGQVDPSDGAYHGRLWYSPDGINWQWESIEVTPPQGRYLSLVPTCLVRDADEPDPQMRYKAYGFTSMTRCRRAVALLCSADCKKWQVHPSNPVLAPEDRGFPWVPSGPFSHVHDVAVFKYGGYYLALYQYLDDPLGGGIELAVSRDGVDFKFVFGEHKVIARGGPGQWDRGLLVASVPVILDDRVYLYYGGSDYRHESDGPYDPAREEQMKVCAGLATLRLDGFSCVQLERDETEGLLETVPLQVPDQPLQLALNADCTNGRITAELLDAKTGQPLPGFSFDRSIPMQVDSTRFLLRWSHKDRIDNMDRPIKIRLRFQADGGSPELFSIGFETPQK